MKRDTSAVAFCRVHLAVFAALLLGGCLTAGPDYKQPAIAAPTNWNSKVDGLVTASPLDSAGLSQWWGVFGDPVLTDLAERAQHGNLDVKQAEARLRKARAERRLASAERMPAVSANASARRSHSGGEAGSGETTSSYAGSLDASWELDLFGARRRAVESSEATLQATQESLRDVMVSLLAEVALNYVQYRAAQVRLEITESNLTAQTEIYDLTRWRQEANLASQLDVDQARVSLEQTRAALPLLCTSLDQAEHQLATLLGEAPGNLKARLDAGPASVPVADSELAVGVPAVVLRQRPDVRGAERRLAAQTAQIGVATAARYPDLTLSGSIGVEALALGDLYTTGARTAQGLLKAGLTAFDGGRIRQNIAIQTALQEEAFAAYEASVLAALKDVEDALVAYANEQFRRRALQDAVTAAESAFKLARDEYASGLVDFQTVLNTQQSMLIVENTLAASQADVTSNLIRLYKALGGGWTPSAVDTDDHKTAKE